MCSLILCKAYTNINLVNIFIQLIYPFMVLYGQWSYRENRDNKEYPEYMWNWGYKVYMEKKKNLKYAWT